MVESVGGADLCISPLNGSCTSGPVTPEAMLIITLLSLISLLTVTLNLLVIISISHFRQLHTPTNLILLSLAVSDLLLGFAVMPAEIILLYSCSFLGKITSVLAYLLAFILTSASVGTMVLISVDRYVAICYPLHYSSVITPRRVQICVSLCWFCSIIYNFILLKDPLSQIHVSISCHQEFAPTVNYILGAVDMLLTFFGPITVIIVLYMRVFVVALSKARVIRSKVSTVKSYPVTVKNSELKAARTLGITVVVFIICLSPYCVPSLKGQDTSVSVDSLVQYWLFYCNSSFNPLIYAFFYPWFRKSVKLTVSLQILQPGSREAKIM